MFRLALMRDALKNDPAATDEAAAVEALGYKPRLVAGSRLNFNLELMRRLLLPTVNRSAAVVNRAAENIP
jgi:2-C-methyl-D-erythritol 4-phosphate cytidylyltransferase